MKSIITRIIIILLLISVIGAGTVFILNRNKIINVGFVDEFSEDGEYGGEAASENGAEGTNDTPDSNGNDIPVPERVEFGLPEKMKAVFLMPGIDFFQSKTMTQDELEKQAGDIIKKVLEMNFNTLIIDTSYEDKVIYSSEVLKHTGIDALEILSSAAGEAGLNVFAVHNIFGNTDYRGNKILPVMDTENIDFITSAVSELALGYKLNGVLVDNYTISKTPENFSLYQIYGTGISYDGWLRESASYFTRSVCGQVMSDSNSMPVGILVNPVWANSENEKDGSKTKSGYQDYKDGFADTKFYIQQNYVDFVMVKAFGSLTDTKTPFNEVLGWWDSVCDTAEKNLYVLHAADKVGGKDAGWNGYDQLSRQQTKAGEYYSTAYSGSGYYTYKPLVEDKLGSTEALLKSYSGEYTSENMFKELTVTSPKSTNHVTYEDSVIFSGKYDPQFEVQINGEKILPTIEGDFRQKYPLEIGENKFTLTHKGNVVTYTVMRKVKIISSVSPTGKMTLDGETRISLQVVAYRGSKITATLNGKTVSLQQGEQMDENGRESIYVPYTGSFLLPKGGKTNVNLGSIRFKGTFNIYSENWTGASVIVKKHDEPELSTAKQIRVDEDYIPMFNPASTIPYVDGTYYSLPKGTIDYISNEIDIGGVTYLKLFSGKRVRKTNVTVIKADYRGANTLSNMTTAVTDNKTTIKFGIKWKAPFNVTFPGLNFGTAKSVESAAGDNYALSVFDAKEVVITFDYANSHPAINAETFTAGSLFSSARFKKVTVNKIERCQLILTLARPGVYRGVTVYYDSGGNMVFDFINPKFTVEGMKIYLDSGHGGNDGGASGSYQLNSSNSVLRAEKYMNYELAKVVKSKLEQQGAIVEMPNTYQNFLTPQERPARAIKWGAELFVSIHHNAAASKTAGGSEAYYNSPFSKGLAKNVADSMGRYYNGTLYTDGKNRNRGDIYSRFTVTGEKHFPSILLEAGFMSNPTELKLLDTDTHRDGLAEAIVNGIVNYVKSGK